MWTQISVVRSAEAEVVALNLLRAVSLNRIKPFTLLEVEKKNVCIVLPLLYQKQDCVCGGFRTPPAHHHGDLDCGVCTYGASCLFACCNVSHGGRKEAIPDFHNSIN